MNPDLTTMLRTDIQVPEQLLQPHTTLDDAGIDSLAVVELSMLFTQRLGITVTDAQIARSATLGDLDRLLRRELADQHRPQDQPTDRQADR